MGQARDIMHAMADVLRTELPGCRQAEPRLCLTPDDPCIDIYPDVEGMEEQEEAGFGTTLTGALLFTVRARVNLNDHDASQDILLDWMDSSGAYSVAALLEDDQTLDGLASSVDVGPVSGYIQFVDSNGQISRLGCQWRVRVIPAVS